MTRWTALLRRAHVARLATHLLALWKLFRRPETPRLVKWLAVAIVAYAVSPIDLIPDFIPLIGMLDDVILLPLGIALVVKLTPAELWRACLAEAEVGAEQLPRLIGGAVAIVVVWLLLGVAFGWWLLSWITAGA